MNRDLRAGVAVLGGLLLLAVVGPVLVGDPLTIDPAQVLRPPGTAHWFGTDELGRDVLARVVHGARTSLAAGLAATLVAFAFGSLAGALSALAGGAADTLFARCADTVHAFPPLVGVLALVGLSGARSGGVPPELAIGALIGLFAWPVLFRFVRDATLTLRAGPLADAARAAGAGPWRTAVRHLLPLALGAAVVPASFIAGGSILVEAALGFLGVGVPPPRPSWGALLTEGMRHVGGAWWLTVFPGLGLFAAVAGCYLVGEGLRRSGRVNS